MAAGLTPPTLAVPPASLPALVFSYFVFRISLFDLQQSQNSTLRRKTMSSLSPKDRVSLCSFAFSDGRRCRTPRISYHPHFCYYHAQKEARACAAQKLGKDLD